MKGIRFKMKNNEITIEKLLNEYNKYIISRLIGKEYDFNIFREMVKTFSKETESIEYTDELSNQEVVKKVKDFIDENNSVKKFDIK